MTEESVPRHAGRAPAAERSSASLLVRCWLEPASAGEPPTLRGYVKNLKTGEELYIKDLDTVGEQIRRTLIDAAGATAASAPARAGRASEG